MSRGDVIGIVGAGRFGTALAYRCNQAGREVVLLSGREDWVGHFNMTKRSDERHRNILFGAGVQATLAADELARRARFIVLATSSNDVRTRLEQLAEHLDGGHIIVHAIGGFAPPHHEGVCDLIVEETPCRRVGVLAGPALPADLVSGEVASMVCASAFDEVTSEARRLLNAPPAIRIYRSRDWKGVELSSALVGAYSIAVAVADELSVPLGSRALLITRIVAEMTRLVVADGGQADTVRGLAGLGNLLVRGESRAAERAPSYEYGRLLSSATNPKDLSMPEGARAVAAGVAKAKSFGVATPILGGIATAMSGSRNVKSLARSMMALVADVE